MCRQTCASQRGSHRQGTRCFGAVPSFVHIEEMDWSAWQADDVSSVLAADINGRKFPFAMGGLRITGYHYIMGVSSAYIPSRWANQLDEQFQHASNIRRTNFRRKLTLLHTAVTARQTRFGLLSPYVEHTFQPGDCRNPTIGHNVSVQLKSSRFPSLTSLIHSVEFLLPLPHPRAMGQIRAVMQHEAVAVTMLAAVVRL